MAARFRPARPTRPRTTRRLAAIATVTAVAAALSGCINFGGVDIDPDDFPVGLDEVQSATLQITAQGEFYEPLTSEPLTAGWYGSGFVISASGLAITNNHVAAGASSFDIRPGGGTGPAIGAEVVSTSECLDLAVLQLPPGEVYPFMAWRQGDIAPPLDVYSAGYPNGTPAFTLTGGIVSTANQSLEFDWASVDAAIEHDARIRGGNSGGPLIDENGRIVGVNYAGDDLQDYNYAIAREQVLSVLDQLIAGENVLSLGINGRALPLDSETGESVGIWVQSVQPGSPAEAAGIKGADVLIEMDGTPLSQSGTMQEYCDILASRGTDATLDLVVARPLTGEVLEGQVNGEPLSTTDGPDPIDPINGGIEAFVEILDDSGSMIVEVPESWGERLGAGYTDEQGTPWPTIAAAPNLDAYIAGTGPGVLFVANPEFAGADPATFQAVTEADLGQQCTFGGSDVYEDGFYTGLYSIWTDCEGGATYYVVAANALDETHFVQLSVAMFDEYDATTVLERVLNTFFASF